MARTRARSPDRPAEASAAAAAAAAESAIQRLVVVAVPLWLLSTTVVALAPGSGWSAALVLGCVLVTALAYVLFIRTRRPAVLLVPLVGAAVLLAVTSPPSPDLSGGSVVSTWASLTALCLGALLPGVGGPVGALLGGVGPLALARVHQEILGTQGQTHRWIEVATFAVFAGMYTAAVVRVLRTVASEADEVAELRARAGARAAEEDAAQEELRRVARLLHDTVVNTLCAIHRWTAVTPEAARARCGADLQFLRSVEAGGPTDPGRLLDSARARARLLGVDLEVVVGTIGPELDAVRAVAIEGACWEALNNVSRHSGASGARLAWDWDGAAGRVVISDAGAGFRATGGWTGGAAESVAARCDEAGVVATVESAPGSGTVVTLDWTSAPQADHLPDDAVPGAAISGELDSAMATTVLRICAVVGGVGLVSTIMQPPMLPRWASIVALAVIGGVALVARSVRAGVPLPRIPIVVYPLLVVAVTVLPALGRSHVGGIWWWGPPACLAVAVPAFLLDRRRGVIAVAVLGAIVGIVLGASLIGPGPGSERPDQVSILIIDLGGIAALVAYRRRLTNAWVTGRREQERMQSELAGAARAAEQSRIRTHLLTLARQVAEPLLVGVAEGALDPRDPSVREQCGRAEKVLRALSAVPVAPTGGMGTLLAAAVVSAPANGVELGLSLGPDAVMPPDASVPGLGRVLAAVIDGWPSGGSAQLTLLRTGPTARILLLADMVDPPAVLEVQGAAARDGEWSVEQIGEQLLCEATWPVE